MMSNKRLYAVVGAAALLSVSACDDLDVTNPNNPDIERALASPDDVKALAVSTLNTWYLIATGDGASGGNGQFPQMMSVTADVTTSNFGNFGMRFNNLEPRIPFANSTTNNDRFVNEDAWDGFYGAIGAANDALRAMKGGILSDADRDRFQPLAMFSQAASYTYLSLTFDEAFVVTEDTDPTDPPDLVPYTEVRDSAAAMWERLIAITAGKNHSYGITDIPMPDGVLTSARLNSIGHTLYALLLAYTPRNPSQSASVDWAKVADLASAGITSDFEVQGDGQNWYSYHAAYGDEQTWIRVDHRVINRMAPSVPPKFDGTIPPQGTSPDARYTTDFEYVPPPIGDPARGIYMQSVFAHVRYVDHAAGSPTAFETAVPFLLRAENDLAWAEAEIRGGGSLALAAELINRTRVGRGNLAPATAAEGADGLLSRISYERDVELMNTSATALFWRRAVTDQPIQAGTPCQLPIPEKELQTLGLPTYTFGGNLPCS